jgi:hypothetical protein
VAFSSPSEGDRPAGVRSGYTRRDEQQPPPRQQGLSIQTLVIAAIASATAAIVISHIWTPGTIIASAMTPVIVALVSEAIRRPMQSEAVRRPVRAVGSVTASRRSWRRGEARPPSGRTPNVMAPPTPGVDEGLRQREEGLEPGPVRVYSSGSNRQLHTGRRLPVKIAIVTGLIAFAIAAVALTVPELIFGGSVTGKSDTTYFGGGGTSSKSAKKTQDNGSTTPSNEQRTTTTPSTTGTTSTPSQTTPSGSGGGQTTTTAPTQTAPPSQSPPPTQSTPATPATPPVPAPTTPKQATP